MASVRTSDPGRSSLVQWYRELETFGEDDAAIPASGPCGETDDLW